MFATAGLRTQFAGSRTVCSLISIRGLAAFVINPVIIRTGTVKQTGGTGSNGKTETFAVVAGRVGKVIVLSLVVKSLSVIAGNEIDAGELVGWQTEISVCR